MNSLKFQIRSVMNAIKKGMTNMDNYMKTNMQIIQVMKMKFINFIKNVKIIMKWKKIKQF